MTLPRDALAYLAVRGISARAAARRRLREINGADAPRTFGPQAQGRRLLGFPYFGADGAPLIDSGKPFVRGRILAGAGAFRPMPTKGMKFVQPAGTRNHLYYDPARRDWPKIVADPSVTLVITEGEVKAIAATEHGLVCVALGGVSSWRTRVNGPSSLSAPLPDLDATAWAGRPVEIAFDSDAVTNPDVLAAMHALATDLTKRGSHVVRAVIPPGKAGAKVGLDDFLKGGGKYDKLAREPIVLVLDPAAPLGAARAFLGATYQEGEGRTLYYHRGNYMRWTGARYEEADPQVIRAEVHQFLDGAAQRARDGNVVPFLPNRHRTDDALDSLRAETTLDRGDAPLWLDGRAKPAAADLIAARNGLIHLPSRQLLPHTSRYYNTSALDFDYDPKAPPPARWLRFLDELWAADRESIDALQEWIGYIVSGDRSQQKILSIVGPKRAGKGTIGGVMEALIGKVNVTSPTLHAMSENFGRESLIGKKLATLGDVRLANKADQQALIGVLLAISGRDRQTIPRKHKSDWQGMIDVQVVLMSNEILKIEDASGTIASRFIILKLTRSFYGHEDLGLADALRRELPGILNWALDGLARLKKRGHFIQPKSAREEVELFADTTSPVSAFLRDRCHIAADGVVRHAVLFDEWKSWCEQHGRLHPGTMETLGVALRSLLPGQLRNKQVRFEGIDGATGNATRYRGWAYVGLRMKGPDEDDTSKASRGRKY